MGIGAQIKEASNIGILLGQLGQCQELVQSTGLMGGAGGDLDASIRIIINQVHAELQKLLVDIPK